MDRDYLMTVLTREDLAHGAKTWVHELTGVFMGTKGYGGVYGLEWHSPPSFQSFIWSQYNLTYG